MQNALSFRAVQALTPEDATLSPGEQQALVARRADAWLDVELGRGTPDQIRLVNECGPLCRIAAAARSPLADSSIPRLPT